ncbi:hypothetical protein FA15DRAFT_668573 [Coprinopsis marcescibilis]|uniref:F-box domain-containing protein n=1 Tax=Coprinopsis marcescibilis TaxID=230819 RepID=A0A5C3KZS6_COPMA|nr:hypothetical protein FA15DRAFT_668573 [Coprinopsis marcescibilis]
MVSAFPPELIREIVTHLQHPGQDDRSSLKTATLISSAFRPHCQKILFFNLKLKHPEDLERTWWLLENSKAIQNYTKKLSLYTHEMTAGGKSLAVVLWRIKQLEIIREMDLSRIFRVESISAVIASILSSTKSPILALFIQRRYFEWMTSFTPLLKRLRLCGTMPLSMFKLTPSPPPSTGQRLRLHHLHLSVIQQTGIFRYLFDIGALAELRTLNIWLSPGLTLDNADPISVLRPLILGSASSLNEFRYEVDLCLGSRLQDKEIFDLSGFTRLRELSLCFGYFNQRYTRDRRAYIHNTPFRWVIGFLQTATSETPLERFRLRWDHVPYDDTRQLSPDFDFQAWEELDSLFTDRSRFSRLKKVHLQIRIHDDLRHQGVTTQFKGLLKNTADLGILRVCKSLRSKFEPR